MKAHVMIKKFIATFLCLVAGMIVTQTAAAIPPLTLPQPNIYLYSMPAPDYDSESGLLKGEVIIRNSGGNHTGVFQISVWIEGFEQQTKLSVYAQNMPGFGFTKSYTYHFNLTNPPLFTPYRSYWVIAEMDNHTIRSRNSFMYLTPGFLKPNLTIARGEGCSNGSVFNSTTNEMIFSNSIVNQGTDATGPFNVKWYLSEDENITTADIEIGSYRFPNGLEAQSLPFQIENATFDLDSIGGLDPGNYYIGVIIDAEHEVDEQWEDDNYLYYSNIFAWDGPSGDINLKFCETQGDSYSAYDPATHVFSFLNTIENDGLSVSAGFRVRHYLYSPSIGYILLDTEGINSLQSSEKYPINRAYDLDSISGLPNGDYSIVAFIDDQEIITETDETDNFGSFAEGAALMFNYTNSTKPDLRLYTNESQGAYNSMLYLPETHEVLFRNAFANYGTSDAPLPMYGYYLSKDQIINPKDDYLLFYSYISEGIAGGHIWKMTSPYIANLDNYIAEIPLGTYYFGVYIDDDFAIDEFNENNNFGCFVDESQIIEWRGPFCNDDLEPDGDVDGLDLINFAISYASGVLQAEDIPIFAQNFGRTNCDYIESGEMVQQSAASSSTNALDDPESFQTNIPASYAKPTSLVPSRQESFTTQNLSSSSEPRKINWKPIEKTQTPVATGEVGISTGIFSVEEVNWTSSSGQNGTAIGDIEWLIKNIKYSGTDSITVNVTDTMGEVREKTIRFVYEEILPLNSKYLPQEWLRRFSYTYNFDENYIQTSPPSAAELTLFCWPDEIRVVDDYNITEILETIAQPGGENSFEIKWNILCDSKQKDILYLDIPIESVENN